MGTSLFGIENTMAIIYVCLFLTDCYYLWTVFFGWLFSCDLNSVLHKSLTWFKATMMMIITTAPWMRVCSIHLMTDCCTDCCWPCRCIVQPPLRGRLLGQAATFGGEDASNGATTSGRTWKQGPPWPNSNQGSNTVLTQTQLHFRNMPTGLL